MNHLSQSIFVLLDASLWSDAMADLSRRDDVLAIRPVYIGTSYSSVHSVGPMLVAVRPGSDLINEIFRSDVHRQYASLLYSSAPLEVLATHLQRFIVLRFPNGGGIVLRFADPMMALPWLGSFEGEQLNALLGPIDEWQVPMRAHSWEPALRSDRQSFVRQGPPPEWDESCARIGVAQQQALDRATRWWFKERLHQMLTENHPRDFARIDKAHLTDWFEERLDEAQQRDLISDRTRAIWVEYSLLLGRDFLQLPDGPYQQWLASTPDAQSLEFEQQILAMDEDYLIVNKSKDLP